MKKPRQKWEPHWVVKLLYTAFTFLWSLAKIAIGLARGRKAYDKREYLKANDAKREMDKSMKQYK